MTDIEIYHADEMQIMGYGESDTSGAWLKLQILPEDMEKFRGLKGQVFNVAMSKVDAPVNKPAKRPKVPPAEGPYGDAYRTLHRNGFFNIPAVVSHVGSDNKFLEWIRKQPCAITGAFDYNKNEETGTVTERCDAAHYRSIEDGAGVAIKPKYSAIPLVHAWHLAQTDFGYAAMNVRTADVPTKQSECGDDTEGREWFQTQRDRYVSSWVKQYLYKIFKVRSMRQVPPAEFLVWAQTNGLDNFIPKKFLKYDL